MDEYTKQLYKGCAEYGRKKAEKETEAKISSQAAEIERLRAALNLIACAGYAVYKFNGVQIPEGFVNVDIIRRLIGIAQDALKGG